MIFPLVLVWNPFTLRVFTAVSVTTTTLIASGVVVWWRNLRRLKKDVIRLEKSTVVPHTSCGTQPPNPGLNVIWCALPTCTSEGTHD